MSRVGLVVLTALIVGSVAYLAGIAGRGALEQQAQVLADQVDDLERTRRLQEAGTALATALVEATYGSFADARASAATFFDALPELQADVTDREAAVLTTITARRDDIQALLTQDEQIARDQLADVWAAYHEVLTGRRIELEIPTGLPEGGARP